MARRADINLIPTELQTQRKIEAVKKSFNYAGFFLFAAAAFISIVFFLYKLKLSSDLAFLQKAVGREQEKINDLSVVETDANRLKAKSQTLTKVFQSRNRFSTLFDTLAESTPRDVVLTSFSTAGDNKMNVSGNAQSYVSLANFILTLLDANFGGKVFNGADLTSVTLDELSGQARFSLILYLKNNALSEPVKEIKLKKD